MKNYLIPHKGNKYEPHVFKTKNMLFILLLGIIITLVSYLGTFVIKNTNLLASIQTAFLVDLANEDRVEQNVATLTINPVLVEAAQRKANDMATKGYFAHTSPEGLTPWYWFKDVNYNYIYAGENLAVNFTESVDVHKAWIASPTHKKNILDQRFTEVGIATADGFYKGRKATFVVQMFGKPRASLLPNISNTANVNTVPIVVAGPDTETNPTTQVFGAQDEQTSFASETNTIERMVVSPLSVGRIAILGIVAVLSLAILFRIIIEFKRHHIGRVLLLILVILGLLGTLFLQKEFFMTTEIAPEEAQTFIES